MAPSLALCLTASSQRGITDQLIWQRKHCALCLLSMMDACQALPCPLSVGAMMGMLTWCCALSSRSSSRLQLQAPPSGKASAWWQSPKQCNTTLKRR